MTAKIKADASGTKLTVGTAAEDALEIDSTAKTIKPVSPYAFSGEQKGGTTAPAAGQVGELLTNSGGPVDIGIALAVGNMAAVTLTPGVWDVQVYGSFNFSAAGGSLIHVSGSLTPGALGSISSALIATTLGQGIATQISGFLSRQVVTANTTVTCTVRASGASGTCQCIATINARRVA